MYNKLFLIAVLPLIAATLQTGRIAFGQTTGAPQATIVDQTSGTTDNASAAAVQMSAMQFAAWCKAETRRIYLIQNDPKADKENLPAAANQLSNAVLQRLQRDKLITSESITMVVDLWRLTLERTPLNGKATYPQTKKFLEALIQNLALYPELLARIHETKALCLEEEGDRAGAATEYDKAGMLFNSIHLETDAWFVGNAMSRGDVYRHLGDKTKAEAAYEVALTYPFNLVNPSQDDPQRAEIQTGFRNYYLSAGRKVLELRRHDLKALQETRFWPMASIELGPTLEQYTEEARRESVGDTTPVPLKPVAPYPLIPGIPYIPRGLPPRFWPKLASPTTPPPAK